MQDATPAPRAHRSFSAPLFQKIVDGQIDPSFVVTHTVSLEDGLKMDKTFREKEDGCINVVMQP